MVDERQTNNTFPLNQHTESADGKMHKLGTQLSRQSLPSRITNIELTVQDWFIFRHFEMHLIILKFRICKSHTALGYFFCPMNALKCCQLIGQLVSIFLCKSVK